MLELTEAIVKGESNPEPGIPESFKVLIKELQSLCLDVKVLTDEDKEIEVREFVDMDDTDENFEISLIDDMQEVEDTHIIEEIDDELVDETDADIDDLDLEEDMNYDDLDLDMKVKILIYSF